MVGISAQKPLQIFTSCTCTNGVYLALSPPLNTLYLKALLGTEGMTTVEADPRDIVWGTGLGANP
jgi:hypothetical protein